MAGQWGRSREGRTPTALALLGPALAGMVAALAVLGYADLLNTRRAVILVLGLAVLLLVLRTGLVKESLLIAWVLAIPYPRTYFFGSETHGFHGPYLISADLALAGLYAVWWWQKALSKQDQPPFAARWWPWFLPFLIACLASGLGAERADWVWFELIRVVRFGLILFYARYQFGARELILCGAALAASVIVECTQGLLQVATHKFGARVQEGEEFVRATGVMLHPNVMGSYLLLVLPALITLAFLARKVILRKLFLTAAALAAVGLVATLSRAAWALLIAEVAIIVVTLTVLHYLSIQRLIFFSAAGILLAGMAAYPVRDAIGRRITGNLKASLDTRGELNEVARRVWSRNELLGVGLNNLEIGIRAVSPRWHSAISARASAERNIRARIIVIHNLWLFLAAELGWLGLVTFVWLLLGILCRALSLLRRASRPSKALGIAFTLGLAALAAQQILESTLWVDGIFLHLAFVAGWIGSAGAALPRLESMAEEATSRSGDFA